MIEFLLAQDAPSWVRGSWANQTVLHPVGIALLIVLGAALIALPRRYAVIPIFLMMCVAGRQRISILTLDWDFLRLMVVLGWARVLVRKETRLFRAHRLDSMVVIFAMLSTAGYIIQQSSGDAVVYKLGVLIDTLGAYYLFRVLIRTWDDVLTLFRGASVIAVPVAGAFMLEKLTGRNPFAMLGSAPEITRMREGRLRCQGAFAHPILAGSFWAGVLPYYLALIVGRVDRTLGILGFCSGLIIIFACASSTPAAAVGVVLVGWGFFVMRDSMSFVRWSAVAMLVVLQLMMKAPVYHLISRIDLVGGSTGWHRYYLIDQFVHRWSEWFLVGTPSTAHWGRGLFDVTNQYVLEAVRGGFLAFASFLAVIVVAFMAVSRACKAARSVRPHLAAGWGIGVAIFAHCVMFLAVSYFGQIVLLWQLSLALAASAAVAAVSPVGVRSRSARQMSPAGARGSGSPRAIGGAAPRPVPPRRAQERPA